jgi:hypothetical protein
MQNESMEWIASLSTTEGTFSPSTTASWKCKVPDNSALHVLTKAFCTVFVMVNVVQTIVIRACRSVAYA